MTCFKGNLLCFNVFQCYSVLMQCFFVCFDVFQCFDVLV